MGRNPTSRGHLLSLKPRPRPLRLSAPNLQYAGTGAVSKVPNFSSFLESYHEPTQHSIIVLPLLAEQLCRQSHHSQPTAL